MISDKDADTRALSESERLQLRLYVPNGPGKIAPSVPLPLEINHILSGIDVEDTVQQARKK